MGLKKKVKEIAIQAAVEAVRSASSTATRQIVQTNSPFTAKIVRTEGNSFVVSDPQGNEKTVTFIGDRPLGPGGVVIVTGDYCR